MKIKFLLAALVLSFNTIFSQTVKDYKVLFNYVQLPLEPFVESVSNYEIVLENNFEKLNQDTLAAYELRLNQAKLEQENLLKVWKSDKIRIDRLYYSQMSVWEKAVNAGSTTAVQPVKQPYPDYPILKEVSSPIYTHELTIEKCNKKINLAGYNKGKGGAIVTITQHGLQLARISKSITGSGSGKKYRYKAHFKLPIDVKIEAPIQGVVYQKSFYSNESSELISTEKSQYDFQLWWMDNKEQFWTNFQRKKLATLLTDLNKHMNSTYGFPSKSSESEIYVIKKYKDFNYSEFVDAMTFAKIGYQKLSNGIEKDAAKEDLQKAIDIWNNQLSQSNTGDNKSRINKKATALLYTNLAEAYMWIDDFNNADLFNNKAITLGVLKYKNHCKRLQDKMIQLKLRYNSNN